jgi:tetratricopeptide (TPR) repeat protein
MGRVYQFRPVKLAVPYFEEAAKTARAIVASDPLYGNAHQRLGQALYAMGQRSDARQEFHAAMALNWTDAYWDLALVALHSGEYKLAVETVTGMPALWWAASPFPSQAKNFSKHFLESVALGRQQSTGGKALLQHLIKSEYASSEFGSLLSAFSHHDENFVYLERIGGFQQGPNDAETVLQYATYLTGTGFIAHPRYVEMAEAYGLTSVWDRRGAPDRCSKTGERWTCN